MGIIYYFNFYLIYYLFYLLFIILLLKIKFIDIHFMPYRDSFSIK